MQFCYFSGQNITANQITRISKFSVDLFMKTGLLMMKSAFRH